MTCCLKTASIVAQLVKNPPAMREIWVRSLSWEDPLEESMTTHSSILVWRILMDRGAWCTTVFTVTKSQYRSNWVAEQVSEKDLLTHLKFPAGSDGKESTCNAGDPDLIPGYYWIFQSSCLENPHGQRSLVATIHGVAKSWTWLWD